MGASRSVSLVLVVALGAACSKGGGSGRESKSGSDRLAHDAALLAPVPAPESRAASPAAAAGLCRAPVTIAAADTPAADVRAHADSLLGLAQEAELRGDRSRAQALLARAAALDPTNATTAYLLAREREATHDARGAVEEYCRYLALGPSAADSAEVARRIRSLASAPAPVPATMATVRAPRARSVAAATVASAGSIARQAPVAGRSSVVYRAPASAPPARGPAAAAATIPPAARDTVVADGGVASGSIERGGGIPAPQREPARDDTRSARSASRRTAQGAVIGAVIGAAVGAATDRSVRGAVIGAAAGGVIGGVAGHATRGRSTTVTMLKPTGTFF
ncbi:MAG TPA: YMGG-like glycine zipper-containing protein [Gemmatimonadaceae bacterium]|nr:YMGG-like glycine zipper-containing protein [Gemmatimonadaceae bacterium]